MWGGWYDEEHTLEIRRLRPVQPRAAIKVCTKMFGRPMVLNCVADIMAFFVYGGQAIVMEDICKKYFPTPPPLFSGAGVWQEIFFFYYIMLE